jgi:hypothetical protein
MKCQQLLNLESSNSNLQEIFFSPNSSYYSDFLSDGKLLKDLSWSIPIIDENYKLLAEFPTTDLVHTNNQIKIERLIEDFAFLYKVNLLIENETLIANNISFLFTLPNRLVNYEDFISDYEKSFEGNLILDSDNVSFTYNKEDSSKYFEHLVVTLVGAQTQVCLNFISKFESLNKNFIYLVLVQRESNICGVKRMETNGGKSAIHWLV